MGLIHKEKELPYEAGQIYALVNDIESYPAFITGCGEAVVHEREERRLRATVAMGVGKLACRVTTENRMRPGERIAFTLVEGPFRRLEGYWSFDALDGGRCRVALHIEFEFKNAVLKLALNKLYEQVNRTMIEVFSRRAAEVYGDRSGAGAG